MKLVVFLGRRQLDNFLLEHILHREELFFLALLSGKDLRTFPVNKRNNFNLMIEVEASGIFLEQLDFHKCYEVISQVKRQLNTNDIAIVCQDEANVMLAGKLRDLFDVATGASEKKSLIFRNKLLMKDELVKNHIRVPRYLELLHSDKNNYDEIAAIIGGQFIAKPTDSAGSHGVFKISNKNDFVKFKMSDDFKKCEYEVEEYISGVLYHCDSVMKNGKLLFLECSKYTCPNLDFQSGKNLGSIALLHCDGLGEKLKNFSKKVLTVLDAPDGAHHMELFVANDEIIFLEVAARAPGFLAAKMYKNTFGVEPLNLDLYVQADIQVKETKTACIPAFWAIFPKMRGYVNKLHEPNLNSHYDLTWAVKVGEHTNKAMSNIDLTGSIFVWNDDYEVLKRDFEAIKIFNAVQYQKGDN